MGRRGQEEKHAENACAEYILTHAGVNGRESVGSSDFERL